MSPQSTHKQLYGDKFGSQSLRPAVAKIRMEGVALSGSGKFVAVTMPNTNAAAIYRRQEPWSAHVDAQACCLLTAANLRYPHDVDFSPDDGDQLLAVTDRYSAVQIFAKEPGGRTYLHEPVYEISGAASELEHSDGVAFLPPDGDFLAACNLTSSKITIYRRKDTDRSQFEISPCFSMQGGALAGPDGLAFSSDGHWLAVANHGDHSVAIFRRLASTADAPPRFDPEPVCLIQDESMRYPHSVTFSPRHHHLLATNAGANYVSIFPSTAVHDKGVQKRWGMAPAQQLLVGSDGEFAEVNALNKMEGGPKGIAVDRNVIAVCRPESGLSLYRYHEHPDGLVL